MFLIRYFIKCYACGAEEKFYEAKVDVARRQTYLDFVLPAGWREGARDHFYCPKHEVVVAVMVDGQPAS